MRLLLHEPNPLNVLEVRELNYLPKTFQTITIKSEGWRTESIIDELRNWIYNNLEGRYCIVSNLKTIDNKMEVVYQIGFEEPAETTLFSLGCSVLHEPDIKVV